MTYGKSIRASMYLSGTGKSENRLGEQVTGEYLLLRAELSAQSFDLPHGNALFTALRLTPNL